MAKDHVYGRLSLHARLKTCLSPEWNSSNSEDRVLENTATANWEEWRENCEYANIWVWPSQSWLVRAPRAVICLVYNFT